MKQVGAHFSKSGITFTVWGPEKKSMQVILPDRQPERHEMLKLDNGYFELTLPGIPAGTQYLFAPDSEKGFPDPASHFQPAGVHGPSEVVDHHRFEWNDDNWKGKPFSEMIFYELHVGTFTAEGTFAAIIPRLAQLAETGINAIELMPVSEFPGHRNWGYDGIYPYSVHSLYGGPDGLKELVNAAHNHGISVFLDVVFNHLGPEGNYFNEFGPYFTDEYCTPWGKAINMDGEWSDGVRAYFAQSTLHWYEHYHLDGLRVDAIHTIYDKGAVHFWELVENTLKPARQSNGHPFYLIAESDLNSPKVVKALEYGGYGFTAQWLDDFHHALYVLLDEKGRERYADFGKISQLVKAYTDGFVHSGEYVNFRKRRHGASSAALPGDAFIAFNQNHDQVGNRVGGERLSALVDFEMQKVASAALLLAPYIPMFFMGEEYGENAPFFYFVSHSEEELIAKVVDGRKKEFENFSWNQEPLDPQDTQTFEKSKIQWGKRESGKHKVMLEWNKTLIRLRASNDAIRNFNKNDVRAHILTDSSFVLIRSCADQQVTVASIFNLSDETVVWNFPHDSPMWSVLLDSTDWQWAEDAIWQKPDESPLLTIAYKTSLKGPGVKVLQLEKS